MIMHLCASFASTESRDMRSTQLRKKLDSYMSVRDSLYVAIYAPQRHELNLLPLLQEYPQHHYAFPRCVTATREMEFYLVDDKQQLEAGAYGILEPRETCELISASQLDIIIVPGVAFGDGGERLGHGGGYYDRFLGRAPQAKFLALAFREQRSADIPVEKHDTRMESILWED